MTRYCRCTGTQHTCGIQNTNGPKVIYVGQGGPRGLQGPQGTTGGAGGQGVQGVQGTQGLQGTQGTQGTQGVQGTLIATTDDLPEGTTNLYFSVDKVAYAHDQGVASSSWVITHNLGFYPNIIVKDSAGSIVEGEIAYDSANQVTLTFQAAFSGVAYLS